ncbi:TIGR04141 family sporadically distributed protein [Chryseobacterium sp. PS-8]|uniref:TIGR04141 family sporadically distributed protein n=1 Tax=Chryseobacterium indicum TaxID=2766954 RepID=A0ABS9C3Z5_9FLAO|nr:DUF6119 family protein [Chryseobacterium sp. PS-8]MCF2219288.1 TIGR04141 family sporadically distributed protein [Chryseobacterium sp. PS-8]
MSDKIQNNIFFLRDKITVRTKTNGTRIRSVDFSFLKSFFNDKEFLEQKVKQNLDGGYEIKLFYKRAENKIKWKNFIKSISLAGEKILELEDSISESYIILFKNIKTGKIYASTGGYAHITIQEIATTDFGIQILSRIIKLDDKALRATKERNLTGGIQGETKIFRKDYNLYENKDYSKLYNELNALIDQKTLVEKFGFEKSEIKNNSICVVKNSFLLKKSISFQELLEVIKKCENLIDGSTDVTEINSLERITRTDKVLLETLLDEILKEIYLNYLDKDKFVSVEISNKEFERYFNASSSRFYIRTSKDDLEENVEGIIREIQTVINILDKILEEEVDYNEFKKIILNSYIETFDENGQTLTLDRLIDHFCTEINYKKKTYFLIEKDWYWVKESFIENINDETKYFLNENKCKGPNLNKWSKGSENLFNSSHIGENDTYVFDKITPSNVEACDIMKVDSLNNIVYFYHVKKGFDNSMRDLCNQIFISAKIIEEDMRLDYKYLRSLYDEAVNYKRGNDYYLKVKRQFKNISQDEFIEIFKNKKIVFVLSVLDTNKKGKRNLYDNIDKYNSNIAKFTLIDLSKQMRTTDIELQILQIEK